MTKSDIDQTAGCFETVNSRRPRLAGRTLGLVSAALGQSLVAVVALVLVAGGIAAVPAGAAGPKCNGKAATIVQPNQFGQYVGTSGNDVIVASALADTIDGRGGNDTICGLDGNDTIFGFDGNDTILGGPGHDALYGEGGRDVLRGDDGDDFVVGSQGRDACYGGPGQDSLGPDDGCEKKRGFEL